jgi:hypothetical protein
MSSVTRDELRRLLDRRAIQDCMIRFCRGIDRLDHRLVLSAFHSDAIDDHGGFIGSPRKFVDWAFKGLQTLMLSTQHKLTTHNCTIDGDTAHAETYYHLSVRSDRDGGWAGGGRYVDRLTRRNGEWRIAHRYSLLEWASGYDQLAFPFGLRLTEASLRDAYDPSYRPERLAAVSEASRRARNGATTPA